VTDCGNGQLTAEYKAQRKGIGNYVREEVGLQDGASRGRDDEAKLGLSEKSKQMRWEDGSKAGTSESYCKRIGESVKGEGSSSGQRGAERSAALDEERRTNPSIAER
jgi:hypothetical protein